MRVFDKLILWFTIFSLSLNCVFVFAETNTENEELPILTVDEAVKKATSYSRTLKNIDENTMLNDQSIDSAQSDLRLATEAEEGLNLAVKLKELNFKNSNYKATAEIEKESIKLSVISFFADVINAEKELELYNKSLEISEKELEISKTKLELGLLSQSDYDSQKISYNKELAQRDAKKVSIDNAYISLNKVMGTDLNNRYNLSLDLDYNELSDANLDLSVNRAVSSLQSVVEKENSLEIAKYELETHNALVGSETYESKQVKVSQASRELSDAKTSAKEQVINAYNEILTAETSYKANLAELEKMKNELEVNKVKYELGKITELEIKKAEYEIEQMESSIQSQIYKHEILVMKFNNPNLI